MNRRGSSVVGAAFLAAALLAACSGAKSPGAPVALPSGAGILQACAQAMGTVTSAHVELTVAGPALTSLPLKSASGEVDRNGEVEATANVSLGGVTIGEDVIVIAGTLYLKSALGGAWSSGPASSFYDPSTLLDPSTGLPSLLTNATDAQTLDSESVESTPAYKVQATVPTAILQGLTNLASGQSTVTATLWVARNGNRLLQVKVPFRVPGHTQDTVVTVALSQFDLPVSIKAPATS